MVFCRPLFILSSLRLSEKHFTHRKITFQVVSINELENLGFIDVMVRLKTKLDSMSQIPAVTSWESCFVRNFNS